MQTHTHSNILSHTHKERRAEGEGDEEGGGTEALAYCALRGGIARINT